MSHHDHDHSHSHDHDDHQDHDHGHDHSHSHGPGHSHETANFDRAFAIGVVLNSGLVVGQIVFGLIAHSLALVADAGHNFADVLGLLLAWWASRLVKSVPTRRHTYGLRGVSILAALANAVLLLVSMGAVGWEAITRLQNPPPVHGNIVIWLASIGIVVNGVSAWLFFSGRKSDLNIRGAFLHLAADAAISLGVVGAGVAMVWTGKLWIDPVASLVIVVVILYGTWGLLKDSVNLSLQAVPGHIDRDAVEQFLKELPGISNVHDLHIWAMSTKETALTAHLVKSDGSIDDKLLGNIAHALREKFSIGHATIQLERCDPKNPCKLVSDRVV